MTDRLSGVVTSAKGGSVRCLSRRWLDVSPVRRSTRMSPPSAATARSSERHVSVASARSGVIHSTSSARDGSGRASAACSGPSQAASVLPLPVGEWIRPDSPACHAAQASLWKSKTVQPSAAYQRSVRAMASATLPGRGGAGRAADASAEARRGAGARFFAAGSPADRVATAFFAELFFAPVFFAPVFFVAVFFVAVFFVAVFFAELFFFVAVLRGAVFFRAVALVAATAPADFVRPAGASSDPLTRTRDP